MKRVEGEFIEAFRSHIAHLVDTVPEDAEAFVAWFEALKDRGPGQWDPLFDWLEGSASLEDLKWFLTQEAAGEAGFDDLVALTQVKIPDRAKLELARNYWDEMGRGNAKGMHGPMLERTSATLGLSPTIDATLWQSLCLANTMTAFATTRRYAWHSIGALGVVELTRPNPRVKLRVDELDRQDRNPQSAGDPLMAAGVASDPVNGHEGSRRRRTRPRPLRTRTPRELPRFGIHAPISQRATCGVSPRRCSGPEPGEEWPGRGRWARHSP